MMRGIVKLPKDLIYESNFISIKEEQKVLNFISHLEFQQVIIHDNPAKRTIKFFGKKYNEEGESLCDDEIPKELLFLRDRCAAKANLPGNKLASCLISQYPKGATVGWHSDARVYGSQIFGVSFNSPSIMQFQQKRKDARYVYELELQPRSFYLMSGESRYFWQHRIIPTKDLRYSITFRLLLE